MTGAGMGMGMGNDAIPSGPRRTALAFGAQLYVFMDDHEATVLLPS